ncbi:MAG: alpha/beta hydrolase [Lachnospiraceae bacterium]|nr:alpha/beta hydrolase [Lachnospiraceae bacterium]MBQ2100389.1 alpha/beta hydrolase [Lachnospiraceae bacterium]MBQ3905194.1 alpha/beta hydrolase [Lachnospiraceae bacterium]
MATKQSLLRLIKLVHGMVDNADLGKQRQSQDQIGELIGHSKDLTFRSIEIEGVHCEWVSLNRAHVHKQVILHCHGGGYSTGSSLYARTLTSKLAACTAMEVLSFDYRLAPEHPFPAQLEDAMKVWDYLMKIGYGARDVIVTGDSAGGNLALTLTLKLKEQGRFLPRGLVLMSPWTDLTSSGDSFLGKKDLDPVLSPAYINRIVHDYTKGARIDDPYVSPLFGDFTGFPPTYVQVGENEILLDDSTRLVERMKAAGVVAKLDIFPGMWHVFQMAPFKTAYEAMDKNVGFIIDELMHF